MHSLIDAGVSGRFTALWFSAIAFAACVAAWTVFSLIGMPVRPDLRVSQLESSLLAGLLIVRATPPRFSRSALAVVPPATRLRPFRHHEAIARSDAR